MVDQRDGSDAVQLDLVERVVESGLQKRRRAIGGTGVVDDEPDVDPVGRIGQPRGDIGVRQVLHHGLHLDPVALPHAVGDVVQ